MSTFLSDYLKATNFGFSLPTDSTIDGIEVSYRRKHTKNGNVKNVQTAACYLVTGGTIQTGWTNMADIGTYWSSSAETVTYGDSTELWGSGGLDESDVEDSGFGVAFYASYPTPFGDTLTSNTLYVYWVAMTVYYTEPAGSGFITKIIMMG